MYVTELRWSLYVQSSPYLDMRKPPDDGSKLTGNARYEGYCVDLSQMLFEMLDMDYELRLVGDVRYGSKQPNGTWDGMVGELTNRVRRICMHELT